MSETFDQLLNFKIPFFPSSLKRGISNRHRCEDRVKN